ATAVGGHKGADRINASTIYQSGTAIPQADAVIHAGATQSLSVGDHGKTFIYTNVGGCSVTLPAISGLFSGFRVGAIVASAAGAVTFNRSSSDTIWSQNSSLALLTLPSPADGGQLVADAVNSKWYWQGTRSFEGAEVATSTGVATPQAHGLGVVPKSVGLWLRNKTAEKNYSVGDEVFVGWAADQGS